MLIFGVSGFPGSCLWQLPLTTGSHWPNRAGIEPRWCPLPSSQNRTQGHTGASLYLLPFSPSLSRREVTVNYSSTRMSLDRRKYSTQWRFLLQVLLIFFQQASFPFFKICFAKPFLRFMRLIFCVEGLPAPWENKRPGLLRLSHKHSFFCHVLVKVHQDAGRMGTGSGAFRGDKAKSSSSSSVIGPAPLPSA